MRWTAPTLNFSTHKKSLKNFNFRPFYGQNSAGSDLRPTMAGKRPKVAGNVRICCRRPEYILKSLKLPGNCKIRTLHPIFGRKPPKIRDFGIILIFVEISESVEVSRGSEILRFLESTKSGLFKSGLRFFISHFVRFLIPKVLKSSFSVTHVR